MLNEKVQTVYSIDTLQSKGSGNVEMFWGTAIECHSSKRTRIINYQLPILTQGT